MTLWPRRPHTPIGIEVDGRFIRAAQLLRKGGRLVLEAAAVIVRRESTAEMQAADVRRLADVLSRQGFIGTAITLALPARLQLSGLLELPAANSDAPLEQLARAELSRMHRCEPASLEMDYWSLPARRRSCEGTEVMAAACSVQHAEGLLDLFAAADFQTQALDVVAWSLCRASLPLLKAQHTAVLLNLGWECCTIVLLHRGIVVYERTLPEAGVRLLHTRLAEELQKTPEQIDALLDDVVGPESEEPTNQRSGSEQARAIIESHFESMVRETAISCSYVSQRYEHVVFDQVVVSGPGANLPGIDKQINRALETATRVARPADVMECPARLSRQGSDPGLMVAVGMALHRED